MTTKDIEEIAVSAVRDCVRRTGYIEQLLREQSTEPFLDGKVNLYSNKDKKKSQLIGSIDVQVKGVHCNDLSSDEIKYDVSIVDLNAYLKCHGAMYFVVSVTDEENTKIYYLNLTPVKLITILKRCKPNQQTMRLSFSAFPTDANKVLELFLDFHRNSKKQASFTADNMLTLEELKTRDDIKEIFSTISYLGHSHSDYKRALIEREHYLYAKDKTGKIEIPILTIPQNISIFEDEQASITINGKIYYNGFRRVTNKNNVKIVIGKSFSFTHKKGEKTLRVVYKLTDNFKDALKDLEFMIALIKNGGFEIKGAEMPFASNNPDIQKFDLEANEARLALFKDIEQAFKILHIENDFSIAGLSEQDEHRLIDLATAFAKKEPILTWQEGLPAIMSIRIGAIKVLLNVQRLDTEKCQYILDDYFSSDLRCIYDAEDGSEKIIVTKYTSLSIDDYCTISNVCYDDLITDYQKVLESNADATSQAVEDVLKLLSVYKRTKQIKHLDAAEKLNNWIIETDGPSTVNQLNALQITKRKRKLLQSEIQQLLSIIEDSSSSIAEKAGAYILMDNSSLAELYINRLSSEDKKMFMQYPICAFLNRK